MGRVRNHLAEPVLLLPEPGGTEWLPSPDRCGPGPSDTHEVASVDTDRLAGEVAGVRSHKERDC